MTPFLLTLAACAAPTSTTADEESVLTAVPETIWEEWDLGNGMVIDAPANWALGYSTLADECSGGMQSQGPGDAPDDNTISISLHWLDTPVGDFDLDNEGYEGTDAAGGTYYYRDDVALGEGEELYYSGREGIVSVSIDRALENATVTLRDVVLTGLANGDRFTLNASHEFPLMVACHVPYSGGEGDGDESGMECSGETDYFPYENAECDELTGEYPDSVKR